MTFFWRKSGYVESAEWDILCSGPSLEHLDPDEFRPVGPVVAVNYAVLAPVKVDFLCALDPPTAFKLEFFRNLPEVVVMCPERHVEDWREIGLRTWQFPDAEDHFREMLIPKRCPDVDMASYTMTSMFPALGMAIHCGARILNIYGADMAGNDGFTAGIEVEKKSEKASDRRWALQREQLNEIQSHWEADPGVEFNFTQPTPAAEV